MLPQAAPRLWALNGQGRGYNVSIPSSTNALADNIPERPEQQKPKAWNWFKSILAGICFCVFFFGGGYFFAEGAGRNGGLVKITINYQVPAEPKPLFFSRCNKMETL
jgi:hypothetical protein